MKTVLRLTVWIFLCALFATSTRAGSESHGADNRVESVAWFLGARKTVHYCYQASPKFLQSVPESTLTAMIERTYERWIEYVRVKQVDNYLPDNLRDELTFAPRIEPAPGGCAGNPDITFYFGVQNKEVSETSKHYDLPAAFAQISHFEANARWQKGFVWIANPGDALEVSDGVEHRIWWTESGFLENILLHEWGHVFGNDHIAGTVMDSSILQRLVRANGKGKPLAPAIDWDKELYFFGDAETEIFQGTAGATPEWRKKTFLDLTGVDADPQGEVTAKLEWHKKIGSTDNKVYLTLASGGISRRYQIQVLFGSPTYFLGEEIFRRKSADGAVHFDRHTAIAYRGQLIWKKGTFIPVSIERNMDCGILSGGTKREPSEFSVPLTIFMVGQIKDLARSAIFLGRRKFPGSR